MQIVVPLRFFQKPIPLCLKFFLRSWTLRRRRTAEPAEKKMRLRLLVLVMVGVASSFSDVVMIIADDLRPELGGPYGCGSHTPHLNSFMEDDHTVTFTQAFSQIALCAPSRNSFLSGRGPVTTQSWQFLDDFRAVGPDWTSLPEAFKKNGYAAFGAGKVFHPGLPANWDLPYSWDDRMSNGLWEDWLYPSEPRCPNETTYCAVDSNLTQDFEDTQTTERSLALLKNLKTQENNESPYFLAIGYRKPHLQWRFPSRFLVNEDDVATASHDLFPTKAPPIAYHMPYAEFSAFKDVHDCGGAQSMNPYRAYPKSCQRAWRTGYYSAVAFVDSEIGKIIDAVSEETLLVFFGDHGWHLGEQSEWEKFTLFENALRVPLIIRHPSLQRHTFTAPVELLDVYPTIAGLANIDLSFTALETAPLEGRDLFFSREKVSSSQQPQEKKRFYARSMFPRCLGGEEYNDNFYVNHSYPDWYLNDCNDVPRTLFTHMGYSLRSDQWRFTAWFTWNGTSLEPIAPVAMELYDHRDDTGSCQAPSAFDDFENINLASDPRHLGLMAAFMRDLPAQFKYDHLPGASAILSHLVVANSLHRDDSRRSAGKQTTTSRAPAASPEETKRRKKKRSSSASETIPKGAPYNTAP